MEGKGNKEFSASEDYANLIFGCFEKKSKKFNNLFGALLTYTLLFLVLVLIPYFSLVKSSEDMQDKLDTIKSNLDDKQKEIGKKKNDIDVYKKEKDYQSNILQKKQKKLETLSGNIEIAKKKVADQKTSLEKNKADLQKNKEQISNLEHTQSELQSISGLVKSKITSQSLLGLITDLIGGSIGYHSVSCQDLEGHDRLRCEIKYNVTVQIDDYDKSITDDVIAPMRQLNKEASENLQYDLALLKKQLDNEIEQQFSDTNFLDSSQKLTQFTDKVENLLSGFSEKQDVEISSRKEYIVKSIINLEHNKTSLLSKIADNENKYESLTKEKDDSERIKESLEKHIEEIKNKQDNLTKKIASLVEKEKILKQEQSLINESIDENKKKKEKIEEQISKLQSPFGSLPVGLEESVLIFPLVLTIGICLCSSMLISLFRLRQEFFEVHMSRTKQDATTVCHQVKLLASIWIDPSNTEQNNLVRFILFLMPSGAFIVAVAMIWYIQFFSISSFSHNTPWWIYSLLYLFSFIAIIFVTKRLIFSYRSHLTRYESQACNQAS